jgi:putative inorganic carbon (hco3(-)) transporter
MAATLGAKWSMRSTLLLVGAGLCVGLAVAALGARTEPWLPVLLVSLLLIVLASLVNPTLAVALTFAAMPIGPVQVWLGPSSLPVIQIVALCSVAVVVSARLIKRRVPLLWPRQMWWAAALVSLAVLETPLAIDPDAAVKQDLQLIVGVLIALAIVSAVRHLEDVRRLLALALLVGSVMCVIALPSARELDASFGGAVVGNRAHGVFTEPNQLGLFSAILLLLACAAVLYARTALGSAAAGLVLVTALSALGLSLSRGAWLGIALGMIGAFGLLPVAGRRMLLILLVTLAGLCALLLVRPDTPGLTVIKERVKTLSNPTGNPHDARPAIYREAAREILERPLTGFGPAGFMTASARPESEVRSFGAYHAHNALLTVAAEAGLPAAMVLVCLTLSIGVVTLRTVRRLHRHGGIRDAAVVVGLGAALLAVVGQGMVDYTLRHPVLNVLVWAVIGLVLAADRVTVTAPGAQATHRATQRRAARGVRRS